jgi:hypothetical protein
MINENCIYDQPLGKCGRMRLKYIKEAKPALYGRMKLSGELEAYLYRIDEEAGEMLYNIEGKYIERHPLPSGDDFIAVVRARNTARMVAEELVLHEMIYC